MGGGSPDRPDESEAYRALAEQSATYFNRYKDVFVPLENQYIQSVFDAGSGAAYQDATDSATSITQAQFDDRIGGLQSGMLAKGVDPSSGRFQAGTADAFEKLGAIRGLAGADAGLNNTDRFVGGIQNVVKMGQGLASEAMQGQIGLASTAEDKIRSQFATDFADDQQRSQALGTAAGMAAGGAYNYFGSN
jgi:hypothetical protein